MTCVDDRVCGAGDLRREAGGGSFMVCWEALCDGRDRVSQGLGGGRARDLP